MTVPVVEEGSAAGAVNPVPTFVHIFETSVPSPQTDAGYLTYRIKVHANGVPTYSAERWLRLRVPGAIKIARPKVWFPGFVAPEGWRLRWGTQAALRDPRAGEESDIAQNELPTEEPGDGNLLFSGDESYWLVIQARVTGEAASGPLSPEGVVMKFKWDEI